MSEFKWIEGWGNGSLSVEKTFLARYNVIPSRYNFSSEEIEFDLENLDKKAVEEKYPKALVIIREHSSDFKSSSVEDNYEEVVEIDGTPFFGLGQYVGGDLLVLDDHAFYEVSSSQIKVYYYNKDGKALCQEMYDFLPKKEEEAKGGEVELIGYNQGYYTMTSKINPTTIDIKKNYNDDFLPVYKDITKFLEERTSGVVLLYGDVGSGKTNFIRNLITNHPMEYIIIPATLAENMTNPEFVSFLLDNRNSVFILEDCEQILKKREENQFGGAVASLLNMADGLMSDICNIKFICTFNADISAIDPALLRKGRCYARYEFKKLSTEKTKVLLEENGVKLDKYEPMTLADIYNYNSTDYSAKENHSIGF